ncbi:MAG TPA: GTPase domain-containing protein, partial [Thermoanaerobaculia bacterium]|nr:GTPase domain-containing protein [Thermoanaerobaculia bacterium]
MALFNHSTKDLTAKIVYYGPGLCGKTTNLRVLHGQLDRAAKGNLLSLATAQDRTIYFDLLPVELGNIKGYTVRFQLCTVPGQVFYNETRKIVLRGVDGIVFVVDSQASMLSHNLESFQNLRENLREEKIALESVPVVIQYNKRDLGGALPVPTMQEALGFGAYPFVEAVASEGQGVVETFRLVSKLTFVDLLRRLQRGGPVATETAAAALAAATEAVPSLAAPVPAGTVFLTPEAERPEATTPVAVISSVPSMVAAVESSSAPVFEEVGTGEGFDGWESTPDDGFPEIDDEPTAESSLDHLEMAAATDLATTRAIEA